MDISKEIKEALHRHLFFGMNGQPAFTYSNSIKEIPEKMSKICSKLRIKTSERRQ